MNPRSETLFHFTRSLDSLKSILRNGFYPRFCMEDVQWVKAGTERLAYPMVCFCDIPLQRIQRHVSHYGRYGVGVSKEWAVASQVGPVIYHPVSSRLHSLIDYLLEFPPPGTPNSSLQKQAASDALSLLLCMSKPLDGEIARSGKMERVSYHQENEWRYLPINPRGHRFLSEEGFTMLAAERNKKLEEEALIFSPNDVRYIFVNEDNEIPELFDFLNSEIKGYAIESVKKLSTRITSIERLMTDV